MKFEVLDSFEADFKRLSKSEQGTFKGVLPEFVAACDRFALEPSTAWPASLRGKSVEGARGIMEMTWSFTGPDGRATFEWVDLEGALAVRWRRIGGHSIFREP